MHTLAHVLVMFALFVLFALFLCFSTVRYEGCGQDEFENCSRSNVEESFQKAYLAKSQKMKFEMLMGDGGGLWGKNCGGINRYSVDS